MEDRLRNEIITYLGDDYREKDASALETCIRRAIAKFESFVSFPESITEEDKLAETEKAYYCIFDIALLYFEKMGAEYEKSHSENGVQRIWKDESSIFSEHGIVPYVMI